MTARRQGPDVVLRFIVPVANTDASRPADLDRIEVYAHTGPLPSPLDFLTYGTLVGNVAVKAPVALGAEGGEQLPGVEQGAGAIVSEAITPAELLAGKAPVRRGPAPRSPIAPVATLDMETPGTVNAPVPPVRYYVAIGTSRRNRRGAFSAPIGVPLVDPLLPPTSLTAAYAEDAVTLTWQAAPVPADIFAPVPVYNLYEVSEPSAAAGLDKGTIAGAPPLNGAPLRVMTFKDPRIEFGVHRCYVVRSVRVAGVIPVESAASPPICLTLADTFAPAAPKSLRSVPSEGAISLIWEPNTEKDLAGYVVLRGEAPGETLTPLTPAPIHETTYRDTAVTPGVTYVYAVTAVDSASKPNVSPRSETVTEVAR
jgi:hypothetical protein